VDRPTLSKLASGALALLAASLLIAACGDNNETTVTETTTEPAVAETTDETGEPTSGQTDGAPPAADMEVTDLTSFSSPSGNIGCQIEPLTVRCDIAERDWKPPSAPPDCELDYGQGLTLTAGSTAELVCAGDTALSGGGSELAYGQSIGAGLLRCESEPSGMRCTDTETGRGFELSRESYKLF